MAIKKETTTEMVKIASLIFDPTVNTRPPKKAKIDKYAKNFDPGALGVIEVSARPGRKYAVLDGQHRVTMLRDRLGWNNGQEVLCRVHRGLSHAEECALFVRLNDETPVSAIHKLLGEVGAGTHPAAAINEVVESVGLGLHDQVTEGTISAANALRFVWYGCTTRVDNGDHPELLRSTLRLLLNAWGKNRDAYRGDLLSGAGMFMLRHGDNSTLDVEALTHKMSLFQGGPSGFVGDARSLKKLMRCEVRTAVAGLMVNLYNQGRRSSKLPQWWA